MIVPSRELMPIIRSALGRGQRVRITANGSSMLPFIRDGDTVELAPLRASLSLGDIVLAQAPGGHYALHRVMQIQGETLFLRGDAQDDREGPLTRQDVLAQTTFVYRYGRIYRLDRGIWRLIGRVWVRSGRIGFCLLHFILRLWRLGRRVQRTASAHIEKQIGQVSGTGKLYFVTRKKDADPT